MVKHYRNITLLIVLFIFTLCFYIIKGAYFEGNGGWIDLINKNAIKGNYDEAMNEYNTAKTFSSQNKDNEQKGKKHLFKAFERTLAKNKNDDKNVKKDESYTLFLDFLLKKWDIDRSYLESKNPNKKIQELHYANYMLEFTCDFEQFSNFITDLEGYEKLFKINRLGTIFFNKHRNF